MKKTVQLSFILLVIFTSLAKEGKSKKTRWHDLLICQKFHKKAANSLKTKLDTTGNKRSPSLESEDNERLNLSIQYRPRTEHRNGYKKLLADSSRPAFITNQRSRLSLSYSNSSFRSKISFQDIRTWGESKNKSDIPSLLLHEAWFELPLAESLSLRIGRQVLKYSDQRLLAASNWNNVGSTHDMALMKYRQKNADVHLGVAYNNDENRLTEAYSNYPGSFYKSMQFLYASKQFGDNLNVSLLEIADGHQKEKSNKKIYWRTTIGLNLDYSTTDNKFNTSTKAYWQGGKNQYGNTNNAYFLTLQLSYAFQNLKITAGTDYFSGNDQLDTNDQVNRAFDNLYGSGHRYLGHMDYFRAVDKHTNGGGINDVFLKMGYEFSKKTSAKVAYHHFSLANRVIDKNHTGPGLKAIDSELGSELDFTLNYRHSKNFSIKTGYSLMFAKESMETITGGNHENLASWGFIMFSFHPQISLNN